MFLEHDAAQGEGGLEPTLKTPNATRTFIEIYFYESNWNFGKSSSFCLVSNWIIDKNRSISLGGSSCTPIRTRT